MEEQQSESHIFYLLRDKQINKEHSVISKSNLPRLKLESHLVMLTSAHAIPHMVILN